MIYKVRVSLNNEIYREIELRDKQTLYTLYKGIISAFSLQGEELASFFISDKDWNKGTEIPLEGDEDADVFSDETETMMDFFIKEVMEKVGARLLFVYDYEEPWTFYVEAIEMTEKKAVLNYPLTVKRVGAMPLKMPKRNMELLELEDDEDEDDLVTEEDGDTESFDELDVDSDLDDF